ncbi:zinc finger protein [Musa troglodytarum]|uniref:Zinc finger protein n=1 Tax=Musa troglodytarum TaxID=320322 RepID=A0A9E7KL33_9LILI|nr:zinc finger protein [Musa troglodytarum]
MRGEEIWWGGDGEIRRGAACARAADVPAGGFRGEFRHRIPALPLDRACSAAPLRRRSDSRPRGAAVGGVLVAAVREDVRASRSGFAVHSERNSNISGQGLGIRPRMRGEDDDAEVVASFRLQKPVALLNANIGKLQFDIFEEIGVPDSSVAIIYLEPLGGSNWTNVVFGVWPYPRNSTLSTTGLSILRESFMSLVVRQSTLHLTASLFGNSWFFEVLKFPGGITIIPPQRAFLLQKVQMLFNFTLNFSIDQVQDKVSELKDQMKAGLLLNSNENLYVRLTNLEGSTVAPPTIVQTSIILAVGNRQPSLPRWKELAQTIRNSSAGNLGLNHTVFGRVKQIRLFSFPQHSLNNGGNTGSPSPAPQPNPDHSRHYLHHHHHHHGHHHHIPMHLAPAPVPNTAPQPAYQSPTPSGCRYRFSSKPRSKGYLAPAAAPVDAPKHSAAPAAVLGHSTRPASAPQHLLAPHVHENSPVPAPNMNPPSPSPENSPVPAPNMNPPSPSPAVSFTHVQPRSEGITDNKPPGRMPSISPAPFSFSFVFSFCFRQEFCSFAPCATLVRDTELLRRGSCVSL